IAVGLELIADRDHVRDDLGVISLQRRRVVKGGARQAHQAASFGNGEAMGPAVTDVVALLGRGVLLEAPLKNSISSACRPTMRSTDPCTMAGVHGLEAYEIMAAPNEALRTILPIAGWCDGQAADVVFTGGADPVLPTPFRIGAAGAATL